MNGMNAIQFLGVEKKLWWKLCTIIDFEIIKLEWLMYEHEHVCGSIHKITSSQHNKFIPTVGIPMAF